MGKGPARTELGVYLWKKAQESGGERGREGRKGGEKERMINLVATGNQPIIRGGRRDVIGR